MKGNYNEIREGDALQQLKEIDDDSIDLLCTDPPYGYSFMGKEWDKAVVSVDVWRECLRVLKAGAFAFVMSAPRQDVLSRMIVNLQDAGFRTDFTSIYWSYASGFPKAANVSKLADKRAKQNIEFINTRKEFQQYLYSKLYKKYRNHTDLAKELDVHESLIRHWIGKCGNQDSIPTWNYYIILKNKLNLSNDYDYLIEDRPKEWIEAEREIIGDYIAPDGKRRITNKDANSIFFQDLEKRGGYSHKITKSATEAAKKLDGSYAGFQPKPAVEVVLTVMKPLAEKSFVDQALANGKGVTWLADCRIPTTPEDMEERKAKNPHTMRKSGNNVLGDYSMSSKESWECSTSRFPANLLVSDDALNGHSKYFDLDSWYDNNQQRAQFIITPKASASERNKGLDNEPTRKRQGVRPNHPDSTGKFPCCDFRETKNNHPTVKPLKLMSYLITMGSRENDIVLDPFCGSGTTLIAAEQLNRKWIGIELNAEYAAIARKRIEPYLVQQKLL